MSSLQALTPVDGRYLRATKPLREYFSEHGLIKHRVIVMVEYLIALSQCDGVPLRVFTEAEIAFLRSLHDLSVEDAEIIKAIETKGYGRHKATNHDVKACELFLRDKLAETSLADVVEWIHWARTSEDVNNLAYALMLRGSVGRVLVPALKKINSALWEFAQQYDALPMLARTHGQPATPTTLGKEFNVFGRRLERQIDALAEYNLLVKCNGASGNHNAAHVVFPEIEWLDFTDMFVEGLSTSDSLPALEVNWITTQIEPHDTYVELFDIIRRANTILLDLCQDLWRYISDDWLVQKPVDGEIGSSAMPHKVNPIDLENAEGNLGVANALLEFFSRKLPVSRLQRDLSDSTVERSFGTALGHCVVAYGAILRGLGKISANEAKIRAELVAHPEVVTEAYQTILRATGFPDAYGLLKDFSRGKHLTLVDLHEFVNGLEIPEEVRQKLLVITPENYLGLAPTLAYG